MNTTHGVMDGKSVGQIGGMIIDGLNAEAQRAPEPTVRVTVDIKATRNFADALMVALSGRRITRAGWNAGGQYVEAQFPDRQSKMGAPYLVLKNAQGLLVPWVPSQGDLFANDWAFMPA